MTRAFELIYNNFYQEFSSTGKSKYPIAMSYSEFLSAKSGRCGDACNALGMALRSMGIKCAFDYSVQWGNQKSTQHSWIAYPKDDHLTYFIDRDSKLQIPQYVHSAKFSVDEPGGNFLNENIKILQYKKGTKVRRLSFDRQVCPIAKNNFQERTSIINNFSNLNLDVTDHYIQISDVKLKIGDSLLQRSNIYLTVFDINKLNIVDAAQIKTDSVTFRKVGTENIYFPVILKSNERHPILQPFLLEKNGNMRHFQCDKASRQTLILRRKYPLLAYNLNNANFLFNGRFQGANNPDFQNPTDLFLLKKTYVSPTRIIVNQPKVFRYYRFIPDSTRKLSIAELEFYSSINGKHKELSGEFISNSKESVEKTANAFDKDFATIFHAEKGSWLGIDLGPGNKKRVDIIKFCPRTDANFIIPGYEYELFYWDKSWVSFQRKIADDYKIVFKNVPTGTLFWLHCLNGGSEERLFTYENGRQKFW